MPAWDQLQANRLREREYAEMTQNEKINCQVQVKDEFGTLCFWCPPNEREEDGKKLNETDIQEFVTRSRDAGYQEEQALGTAEHQTVQYLID